MASSSPRSNGANGRNGSPAQLQTAVSLPPTYLSSRSANALISDLRPTTLTTPALSSLNNLLDELLSLLLTSSQSLSPTDLKARAIPSVFGGTGQGARLGREAVGEAEVELRSWKEGRKLGGEFENGGRGLRDDRAGTAFPLKEAVELVRCRIMTYSTLASQPPPASLEKILKSNWAAAGGSTTDDVLACGSLYITAIIEHVTEHILASLARVVARDSNSTAATLQDLYVALCEDEGVWSIFKGMEVKKSIETSLKPSGDHSSSSSPKNNSPSRMTSTPSGGIRGPSLDQARPVRLSGETQSRGKIGSVRHERTPSSFEERRSGSMDGRGGDSDAMSGHTGRTTDEEFDKLVMGKGTMKVSLTPSRLRNFDSSKPPRSPGSPGGPRSQGGSQSGSIPNSPTTATGPFEDLRVGQVRSGAGGMRSSKSSQSVKKLVPREAGLPEGDEGEEEVLAGGHDKKVGLGIADILQSEPPWASQANGRGGTPSMRETQKSPARKPPMLESPISGPAPSTMRRNSSQTRLAPKSAKSIGDDDENDYDTASKHKAKTPAQELADFFNSVPPPPPTNLGLFDHVNPAKESEKSSGGGKLRSLFRKKGKNPSSGNLKSATSGGGVGSEKAQQVPQQLLESRSSSGLGATMLGRRRSNAKDVIPDNGLRTAPQSPISNGPPSSFRSIEPVPALSRAGSTSSAVKSDFTTPAPISQDPRGESGDHTPTQERVSSLVQVGDPPKGKLAKKNQISKALAFDGAPVPDQNTTTLLGDKQLESVHIGPGTVDSDGDLNATNRPVSSAPFAKVIGAAAVGGVVLGGAAVALNAGRDQSSETLKDKEAEVALTSSHAIHPARSSSLFEYDPPATVKAPNAATTESVEPLISTVAPVSVQETSARAPSEPAIPLSELSCLRTLLTHATSAAECRLLLDSLLSQWKVPAVSEAPLSEADPETRIIAWLLGGSSGPVGGAAGQRAALSQPDVGVKEAEGLAVQDDAETAGDEGAETGMEEAEQSEEDVLESPAPVAIAV